MTPDDEFVAPCAGKSALFDSIHAGDHLEARALCDTCPVVEWCASQRGRYGEGTWGGKLYGAPANAMRMLREDQAFTDSEARAAHARFYNGERDSRTRVGERVYQRRSARALKRKLA